jgi:hypothetical protein
LIAIGVITVLSGLTQLVAPGFVLAFVAGPANDVLSRQLFATVGMFMLVTGGLFTQALLAESRERAIPLWIGIQKLAAFALVSYAVFRGVFAPLSLGVASFDGLSGVLAFLYFRRLS